MPRRTPKYSLHKASGQARVHINGTDYYLGQYGSEASRRRYNELIDEWRTNNPEKVEITIGQLVLMYEQFAEGYYRKNGELTSELSCIQIALRPLVALFARTLVPDFGPAKLKAVRERMVKSGRERKSINASIRRIVRMCRWAVAEELCPTSVVVALDCIDGLKKGRSQAREGEPIQPVKLADVDAVKPTLPVPLQGAVDFQLATAARPSEALNLRLAEIDRSGDVWIYRPGSHKTEHHGKGRLVLCGPKAQAVILKHAKSTDPDAYVFAVPGSDGKKAYRRDNYGLAIRRACERTHNMPKELRYLKRDADAELKAKAAAWRREHVWTPNQLRHTAATEIRKIAGVETSQTVLGHADLRTTEIYANPSSSA